MKTEELKANELRLGNYVQDYNERQVVCDKYALFDFETYQSNQNTALIPIPLTEEWLIKAGFLKQEDEEVGEIFVQPDADWQFILQEYSFTSSSEDGYYLIEYLGQLEINIKHVHTLQNLYFALTGKELTI